MYSIVGSFPEKFITIEEAKSFLKVSHNEDDQFIRNCIAIAVETAESFLHCYLCTKSIEFITEVDQQEIIMPVTPIKHIGGVKTSSVTYDIKDLCYIGVDKISIILPQEVKGKTVFTYQTDCSLLSSSLKHALMSHVEILYEKRVLNKEELDQILSFYKPHRRLLI